jgi:hypothetical protein
MTHGVSLILLSFKCGFALELVLSILMCCCRVQGIAVAQVPSFLPYSFALVPHETLISETVKSSSSTLFSEGLKTTL